MEPVSPEIPNSKVPERNAPETAHGERGENRRSEHAYAYTEALPAGESKIVRESVCTEGSVTWIHRRDAAASPTPHRLPS